MPSGYYLLVANNWKELKDESLSNRQTVKSEYLPAKRKPKTEAKRQVRLKHHLRPTISTRRPHVNAPTVRPTLKAVERSPAWSSDQRYE